MHVDESAFYVFVKAAAIVLFILECPSSQYTGLGVMSREGTGSAATTASTYTQL
jgi:hypothetical protein